MSGPRMFPAVLPQAVTSDRYRAAEVKVWRRLREALSPEWTVFYSRPWLGVTRTGGERDGECDFVVAHPKRGFLAIEVKGGGISYDPSTDDWISRDRDGVRHRISNPVEQAKKAKYELDRRLKSSRGFPSNRNYRMRHGVIFPDAESPPGNLGVDKPRDLFCCHDDLSRIAQWVEQRMAGGDEEDFGKDGVLTLERLLAHPFTLRAPLASSLSDDDHLIDTLTPQQFHILDAIQALPRVAVGGGAGAGKTVVAMEDAARSSQEDRKTLLTCVSEPLAAALAGKMEGSGVIVESFAALCSRVSGKPFNEADGPQQLHDAMLSNPDLRFDAIIVDEAQDFRSHWWIALEAALRDVRLSRIHAYYDSNQSVYGDLSGELAGFQMAPIALTRNLRNTRTIHAAASQFYEGLPVTADGPEGESIQWIEEADAVGAAIEEARRLLVQERVSPTDLAVLAVTEAAVKTIRSALPRSAGDAVAVATIVDFKGLDRRAVVLAAEAGLADDQAQAYVGLSRARTHLSVAGSPEVVAWLRSIE